MFAVAFWSQKEKVLYLIRDRLGIKSLYYSYENGMLIFASELRALLAISKHSPELCQEGLISYLLFGSISEPGTLYRGYHQMPPGVLARYDGEALKIQQYWNIERTVEIKNGPEELDAAVRLRMISDAPLCLLLSAGIDSGILAGLASMHGSSIHALTLGFEDTPATLIRTFRGRDSFDTEGAKHLIFADRPR